MPMCEGKIKYATRLKAERVLNSAWKRAIRHGKDHELPCRAYKCRECKGWHLTSKRLITREERISGRTIHTTTNA